MEKKLGEYRSLLLSDNNALNSFMKDPGGELKKHTGHVINEKQGVAVKHFISAGTDLAGSFPDKSGKVGKAPAWLHKLLDFIWDFFA